MLCVAITTGTLALPLNSIHFDTNAKAYLQESRKINQM